MRISGIPAYIMATPSQVARVVIESKSLIWYHTQITMAEALTGFLISIALAFLIAYLLNKHYSLKRTIYPLLVLSQTVPLIVLAVLFIIWFGFGLLPKILVVVLVCFFPVSINLINGLESVDPDQLNLFRSMGANYWQIFKIVKLPSAMPSFFSGLRISATYSIMAAVIGEWMGAQRGLGYYMTIQQKAFAMDKVLASVAVICLLSLLLVKTIELLEYLIVPWNRYQKRQN
ncbi:MAG: ABC transporter permease [Syntrophomonadaceae bacterium]|nr:ABC transporter permease [Syntrophomonadaceae bacterium]